jgi:hypothetical protein
MANLGGGGGGTGGSPIIAGAAGGKGLVVVRSPSAFTLAVSPGCNTSTAHPGGDKLATFNVTGTLTIS